MVVRSELQYYYLKIAGFMAELLQLRFYGFYGFMAEMEVLWFL